MDTDLSSYKELYLSSARENVEVMKKALSDLPKASISQAAIESLFIKSHSLKGQSMTMGYTGIAKASLAIERFMREVREGKRTITGSEISEISAALLKIEASLTTIATTDKELPLSELITHLERTLQVKI